MSMHRRITRRTALFGAIALVSLLACEKTKTGEETGGKATSAGVQKVVLIATLMSHPSLDALERNAELALAQKGYVDGKTIRIVRRNANGTENLATSFANEAASIKPDVVIAITTPMAQAFARVWRGPLVFAAVTEPVTAGVVKDLAKPDSLITGTSDAFPYREQLNLIREITPSVRSIGVVFNPGESAAQYGIRELRRYAPALGFRIVEAPIATTTDVAPSAENLLRAKKVDALMITSDNTSIAGIAGALQAAVRAHRPLYVGEAGSVQRGGLATVSVGYDSLGIATGLLAARMLAGERALPVIVAGAAGVHVNLKSAELMGIKIPAAVLARATTYREIK